MYESPALEIAGKASDMIKNSAFFGIDGGPTGYNHELPVHSGLEEA